MAIASNSLGQGSPPRGQVIRLDNLPVGMNVVEENAVDLRSFQMKKQIRHFEMKKKQKKPSENLLQAKRS